MVCDYRQAALLQVDPLPLVVLTPKSLLRHAAVASTPRELAEGRFHMVLPDEEPADAPFTAPVPVVTRTPKDQDL